MTDFFPEEPRPDASGRVMGALSPTWILIQSSWDTKGDSAFNLKKNRCNSALGIKYILTILV